MFRAFKKQVIIIVFKQLYFISHAFLKTKAFTFVDDLALLFI